MKAFLLSNMDYIFFIYGLGFIALGVVVFGLEKTPNKHIKWTWLGVFGLLHGALEWSDMLALSLGDGQTFKLVRLILATISFMALLEFARDNYKIKVSKFIYIPPILIVVMTYILNDITHAQIALRYLLGFPAAFWSAIVFYQIKIPAYQKLALYAFLYGIAAGLITPAADFLWFGTINQNVFLDLFGIPIQLVRGAIAVLIAYEVWSIWRQNYSINEENSLAKYDKYIVLAIIGVLLLGFLYVYFIGEFASLEATPKVVAALRLGAIISVMALVLCMVIFFIYAENAIVANARLEAARLSLQETTVSLEISQQDLSGAYDELEASYEEIAQINNSLEERVKSEVEKSHKQQAVMLQQSKMAAMGEMIGAIAHQWRQPLNALGIMIQSLKISYDCKDLTCEEMEETSKLAMQQIKFMSQTIDDFREFFRPNGIRAPFSLESSIIASIELLSPQFKAYNIVIEHDIEANISLDGYKSEFMQAFINIINNSKDAMAHNKIKAGLIKIKAFKSSDELIHILILDNAGGIPSDVIHRIFEPYFTTKEQGKGTGIGLYMTKMIIEDNMNGKISVKNSADGAIFEIIFRSYS